VDANPTRQSGITNTVGHAGPFFYDVAEILLVELRAGWGSGTTSGTHCAGIQDD